MNTENYILTIRAEDRPGLLHLVTGVLNKKCISIISLTAAPTDIHPIVLITLEIQSAEKTVLPLLSKLENIIEVYAVEAIKSDDVLAIRSAFFKIDKALLNTPDIALIQNFEAKIVNIYPDSFLVSKSGNDAAIRYLYNALEGPHLLGFSQTGLVADSKLIAPDELERISKPAA